MALPTFDPATMTLTEMPGRREVELTVDRVRAEPFYLNVDPHYELSYTLYHDMHGDVPPDLDPAYYWAMVLSYVTRHDGGTPYSHTGGFDPAGWIFQYIDDNGEIPVRWEPAGSSHHPEGVYDPDNGLVSPVQDPRLGPEPSFFYITDSDYGWGNVLIQNGPPPVFQLRDIPPPTVEAGSYFVYYEPGLMARYFGRVVLPWARFQIGDSQAGAFYNITDRKFEATIRTRFSRRDISSNPPRPGRVRIVGKNQRLVIPWNVEIEDKRLIFIPFAGPSTVNPTMGPSGVVPKARGVSGDRRR